MGAHSPCLVLWAGVKSQEEEREVQDFDKGLFGPVPGAPHVGEKPSWSPQLEVSPQ